MFLKHSEAKFPCAFQGFPGFSSAWCVERKPRPTAQPRGRNSAHLAFQDAELLHNSVQEADHRVHGGTAAERLLQLRHHHAHVAGLAVDVLLGSSEAFVQGFVRHLEHREQGSGIAVFKQAAPPELTKTDDFS